MEIEVTLEKEDLRRRPGAFSKTTVYVMEALGGQYGGKPHWLMFEGGSISPALRNGGIVPLLTAVMQTCERAIQCIYMKTNSQKAMIFQEWKPPPRY